MRLRTRIFVDFWNYQLNWNERTNRAPCDWKALPNVLMVESKRLLATAAGTTRLFSTRPSSTPASSPATLTRNLKTWLTTFIDRQPSFRVKIRDRRVRSGGVWCNSCRTQIAECPHCRAAFERSPEKGIDAAIATDLLSLAWEGVLDMAVLVSGDSDFVPAVERIQEKGLKVMNATWRNHGHELDHVCWASFDLDSVVGSLLRE
ncbi:MAG: NYN domain-containing protein [Acidimicrobiia bacterium]|nr:NYN domain-containing protein [Acidimicrobiia bacterium]